MSLPSRERGLKPTTRIYERRRSTVAPLAGAWIETGCTDGGDAADRVAPLAGAWIETIGERAGIIGRMSRSPRGSVD